MLPQNPASEKVQNFIHVSSPNYTRAIYAIFYALTMRPFETVKYPRIVNFAKKVYTFLLVLFFLLASRQLIDYKIGGKWREYFPFSMISHPPLDMHLSFE